MLTHGVNVVCAQHEGKRGGLAVAWATQIGIDRILILVGAQSTTRELILASGAFGFNILYAGQQEVGRKFGKTSSIKVDKFEGLDWHSGETDSPLLDDCAICLDCRVEAVYDTATKAKLIAGKIVGAEQRKEKYEPLVFNSKDGAITKLVSHTNRFMERR